MLSPSDLPPAPPRRLEETLLRYLQQVWPWPGVDGLTEKDVLACFGRAAALGLVPNGAGLCSLHPDLEAELKMLLADGWLEAC